MRGVKVRLPAVGLAVLVFVAGGCANEPTAPASNVRPSFAASGGRGFRLVSNAVRYGDTGIHPATGRSGSAAITAFAAISGTSAALTITSYRASDVSFAKPTGNIVKVQIKAFSAQGKLLFTSNQNNLSPASSVRTFVYDGLPAGTTFQVQANVTGIDPRRTDVVTVTGAVVARPVDLRVSPIRAPETWLVNAEATIEADVAELNGDQGARANCVLYVEGVQVDIVRGMWVDAGGVVTCSFRYTFPAVYTYELRVAVENVRPQDVNPANDSRLGRIDINNPGSGGTPPLPVLTFQADVGDVTIDDADSVRTTMWTGVGSLPPDTAAAPSFDVASFTRVSGRQQSSTFTGIYYGVPTFPLTELALSQRVGLGGAQVTLHEVVISSAPANGNGSEPCYFGGDGAGVTYELCYHPSTGFTRLQYSRHTSDATYYSIRTDYKLMGDASSECSGSPFPVIPRESVGSTAYDCYVVNEAAPVGSVPTWSGVLTYNVSLVTDGVRYSAAPDVPLVPINETVPRTSACTTTTTLAVWIPGLIGGSGGFWSPANTTKMCGASWLSQTGIVGSAGGQGQSVLQQP